MSDRLGLIRLVLFLALSISGKGQAAPTDQDLVSFASSPAWRHLLHYQHRMLRGVRSLANNPEFFLHADGEKDPESELRAFVTAIQQPEKQVPPHQRHPQCAFPARYAVVKKHLALAVEDQPCPDFIAWREHLNLGSVKLIFAAAYPNNPASVFGHTLLLLESGRHGPEQQGSRLLDYAVGFLADTSADDNPVTYVVKGISGGYDGYFNMDPYYMTVGMYNNGESRDLWEYPLDLTSEERELLVAHLWEVLMQGRFGYYFFDENCSTMLLALLDAVRPQGQLVRQAGFFVLPLETVRDITNVYGLRAPEFRPSARRVMESRVNDLSRKDSRDFWTLLGEDTTAVGAPVSTTTLDAYLAYQDYRNFQKKHKIAAETRAKYRAALEERARRPEVTPPAAHSPPPPPLTGHHPRRLGIWAGGWDGKGVLGVSVQYGLHDLLANERGYDSFAAIRYFAIDVAQQQNHARPEVASYTVADVFSLRPFTRLTKDFSWHMGLGGRRTQDESCSTCLRTYGEAAGGLATSITTQWLGFTMAQAQVDVPMHRNDAVRAGPSLLLGLLGGGQQQKILLESKISTDWLNKQVYQGDDGWSGKRPVWREHKIQWAWYPSQNRDWRLSYGFFPRRDIHRRDFHGGSLGWYQYF